MKKNLIVYCSFVLSLFTEQVLAQSNTARFAANHCKIAARVSLHDYQKYNRVINQGTARLVQEQTVQVIQMPDAAWDVSYEARLVDQRPDALDVKVRFRLAKGTSKETSLSADLIFDQWSTDNYVLLPAAAYNGNRFEWRRINYSPKLLDPRDIGPDKPTIVTDIPKLDNKNGLSRIQERTGSMSTPSIGFQSPKTKKGFWLLTTQGTRFGDSGIDIEESRDRSQATISLTAPVVREHYKYRITDNRFPSDDKGVDFKEGDTLSLSFRVYFFDAPDMQDLYNRFAEIRKDIISGQLPNLLGFSGAFEVQEKKYNAQNWVPEYGYYAIGMRENFLQDWQIGWTGGMIATYPLLFAGSKETQNNVIRNFDWLFPNGIAPSGFFWDSGEKGTKWYGGDIRKPHTKNWHLVRKSGDGLYYVLKQLMLMDKQKITVKDSWKQGTRGVADAFVKLWDKAGQFGNFVDSQTGDVVVGGSASGGIVPGALALAYQYYKDDKYLRIAKASAEYYYTNNVKNGLTTGGPGDAMQNPDSESCYALVESYTVLYEVTGDKKWLQMAEEVAKQFATWVSSYDYVFPEKSLFGRTGIHSMGAVWANTQNKHGAPAICTHSGVGLLKLYRATGNPFYIELLRDIAHNMTQYMGHPKKPIEKVKDGWMCERVSTTDWLEGIGEITYQSTWAEIGLMLTHIEIPGIYVQPDRSLFYVIDHVKAQIKKDTKNSLILAVTNPTPTPLTVKLLAENAKDRLKPMGHNTLYNGPTLVLQPNETKEVVFKK